MKLYRTYEFFFDRWKKEIVGRGNENWTKTNSVTGFLIKKYNRDYVDYKFTNKFDGSTKITREYLN